MMRRGEFLFLIIATFTVVMAWVISDIIHTHSNVPISPKLQQTLEGVDPSFDQATLDKISKLP